MAFATAEELRLWMGWPDAFTAEETAKADLLLGLAAGTIEDEAGQTLETAAESVTLDGTGTRRLVLPRWPVTAVTSVTEDGVLLTEGTTADYTWSASGILRRIGACWPDEDQVVDVVLTAGHTTLPAVLKKISLRLSATAWDNPGGLSSETLGDHARSWSGAEVGMELTEADRRTISAYQART